MNQPSQTQNTTTTPFYNKKILYLAGVYFFITLIFLVFDDINTQLFITINTWSEHYIPPQILAHITDTGNATIAAALGLFLCVAKPGLIKRLFFTILITAIVSAALKNGFYWPRPATVLGVNNIHVVGDARYQKSFPSGHTMTAFAVTGFYIFSLKGRGLVWILSLFALVVGVSRIAVGAHWPEDVFFGAALGLCAAGLSAYLSVKGFSVKKSLVVASILATLIFVSVFTTPNEFDEYSSIMAIRFLFGLASLIFIFLFFKKVKSNDC